VAAAGAREGSKTAKIHDLFQGAHGEANAMVTSWTPAAFLYRESRAG
jgi:hypothetical protein